MPLHHRSRHSCIIVDNNGVIGWHMDCFHTSTRKTPVEANEKCARTAKEVQKMPTTSGRHGEKRRTSPHNSDTGTNIRQSIIPEKELGEINTYTTYIILLQIRQTIIPEKEVGKTNTYTVIIQLQMQR